MTVSIKQLNSRRKRYLQVSPVLFNLLHSSILAVSNHKVPHLVDILHRLLKVTNQITASFTSFKFDNVPCKGHFVHDFATHAFFSVFFITLYFLPLLLFKDENANTAGSFIFKVLLLMKLNCCRHLRKPFLCKCHFRAKLPPFIEIFSKIGSALHHFSYSLTQ